MKRYSDCPPVLKEFLIYHESIKGQSQLTISEYYLDLRMFLRFVKLMRYDMPINTALEDIPKRVQHYAPLVGVTCGRITIRNQRSRWGSCSSKGNLNFNCLLMLCPEEVRDYVVIHELCHRIEMNHSPKFWAEVERVCPDYRAHRKWLKDHGTELIGRLP